MSEESLRVVRDVVGSAADLEWVSFMRNTDPEQMRALIESAYDPDVEIEWVDTSPDSGPYHGHAGVVDAFNGWLASFETFRFEPVEYMEAGEDVIVLTRQRGTGRESAAPVEMTAVWLVSVRNGKIARLREFSTLGAALDAAAS